MGIFDRISKSIEKGKIEARQEAQEKQSAKANAVESMKNAEASRERALDEAERARRAGDVVEERRSMKRAEDLAKGISDAGRRVYGK